MTYSGVMPYEEKDLENGVWLAMIYETMISKDTIPYVVAEFARRHPDLRIIALNDRGQGRCLFVTEPRT
jgi:hypothetical protein